MWNIFHHGAGVRGQGRQNGEQEYLQEQLFNVENLVLVSMRRMRRR
jgi:hypothetical protein